MLRLCCSILYVTGQFVLNNKKEEEEEDMEKSWLWWLVVSWKKRPLLTCSAPYLDPRHHATRLLARL